MAETKLVDRSGRVVVASDAEAPDLIASGRYAPATPEEVAAELRKIDLSDTGSTIAAGLEGAASGATLGISDAAIQSGLLGNEFAEESRLRAEYNPTARGVGEAAGIIGSTIATGGAAALEQGVARSAGAALGGGALKQALAKGAGAAASGAVEGAVFGVGHELSQAALEQELSDPARLAERLAVGLGMGALMGGALSGVGAAGTSLAVSGAKSAGAGLKGLFRGAGEGAEAALRKGGGVGDDALRAGDHDLGTLLGTSTPEDAATLAELTPLTAARSDVRLHEAADKLGDVQQSSVRKLRDAQQEIERLSDANREALSVAEKPEALRRIVEAGGGPAQSVEQSALTTAGRIEEQIADLAKRAENYDVGGRSAIKQMSHKMESLAARLDEVHIQHRDNPAEQAVQSFRLLDQVKRDLGKAQVQAGRGANGSQEAMREIQTVREGLRDYLEDASVWGEGFAGFQRELNEAWSPLLDVDGAFGRRFEMGANESFATGKSVYDKTRTLADADAGAIETMLKGLGQAKHESSAALYQLKLAREVAYQRKAAQLFGDSPEVAARAAQIEAAAKRAMAAMQETTQTTLDAAKYAGQQANLAEIPLIGGQLAKARQSGGKGLSWARSKLGGADTPADSLARGAQDGRGAIRSAADALVQGAKRAGKPAARTARGARTYLGVRMGRELDAARYQQIGERVRELNDPESPARARGRDRTATLRDARPEVADAMDAQLARGATFLAGKFMSAAPPASDPFGARRKPKMDARTMDTFLRYVDAVQDPQGALDRAAAGDLRREDVEVLREVYPRVYQDLVTDVLDRATRASEMPSYQERVKLGLLLGVPTDPSMTPEAIQTTMASADRLVAQGHQDEAMGGPAVTPGNAKPPEAGGQVYDPRAEARIATR